MEFVKMGRPKKYTVDVVNKLANELIEYAEKEEIPFLIKFALDRRIPPQSFTDQEVFNTNNQFIEALKIAKKWCEYKLCKAALQNKVNPTMAIFALKNIAGWRDAQQIEHLGDSPTTKITIITNEKPKEDKNEKEGEGEDNRENSSLQTDRTTNFSIQPAHK